MLASPEANNTNLVKCEFSSRQLITGLPTIMDTNEPASLAELWAVVQDIDSATGQPTENYSVVCLIDITGASPSWEKNHNEWPGPHQNSPKFKSASWWVVEPGKGGVKHFGYLKDILRSEDQAKSIMAAYSPPPPSEIVLDFTQLSVLQEQVRLLVSELKVTQERLTLVENENNLVAKLRKEENALSKERIKIIGASRQIIEYLELMLALGHKSELEGMKYLVEHKFGENFHQKKMDQLLTYDKFTEGEQKGISELILYFCHCKLVMEENPNVPYGTTFPDYPINVTADELVDDFDPGTPSTSGSNKRKSAAQTGGRGKNKKSDVPNKLAERNKEAKTSYTKMLTNHVQGKKTPEQKKVEKNAILRKKRADEKLAKEQAKENNSATGNVNSEDGSMGHQ